MATLTLDQLEQIAAERFAAANSPAAVAVGAIEALRDALPLMTHRERDEVLAEVRQLLADQDSHANPDGARLVAAGWRLMGCSHPISCASVAVCAASPY